MVKSEKIIVYTDGGARGNPGPAATGVVITDEKGNFIKKYSKEIGIRTNNEAEYEAVIFALQKIKQLFGKENIFFGNPIDQLQKSLQSNSSNK